jgi:hypothetical protein
MPLLGLVDPSHTERKNDEPGRLPKWLSVEDLLAEAAVAKPKWSPWPYELLNAAIEQWQERDYISTTMLTGGCGRSSIIERKEPFIETVDNLYAVTRGTLIHEALQYAARPNSLAEARFFTTIKLPKSKLDVEFSCSPDIITWNPNGLGDYKMTENPPNFYPWKSHTRQVQFNQWVVRHSEKWTMDGEPFDLPFDPREWRPEHLYLVYLGPKGPVTMEVEHTREVLSPKGTPVKRKVPYIWDDETVTDELLPRLRAVVAALNAYPDWPFKDEEPPGFEGPPGWACPGRPWCMLPNCLAKRYPDGLVWGEQQEAAA